VRRAEGRSARFNYAAEVANVIGSTIEGSSFFGLLTLVEIGHIRIGVGWGTVASDRGGQARHCQRADAVYPQPAG
jgi:hypothetical protein